MISDALLIKIAREIDSRWGRKSYEDLLVEIGQYSISNLRDENGYSRFSKHAMILETLRTQNLYDLLYEINKKLPFSKEIHLALKGEGVDLSNITEQSITTSIAESEGKNSFNTIYSSVSSVSSVETPEENVTRVQSKITKGDENMPEEPPEVKAAKISGTTGIIIAIIGILGGLLIAVIPPLVQKWINQPKPTPHSTFLAIEQIPFSVSTYDGERDSDPLCCEGRAELEYINSVTFSPEYLLNYNLSDDSSKYSYAGIAFVFTQSQNFSDYQNIELIIRFGVNVNQIELNFEDIAQTKQPYRAVGDADAEKPFIVPLKYFSKVDLKAIRAISFQVDTNFTHGNDKFTVKEIRLTK